MMKLADGSWQMAEITRAKLVQLTETSTDTILAVRRSA